MNPMDCIYCGIECRPDIQECKNPGESIGFHHINSGNHGCYGLWEPGMTSATPYEYIQKNLGMLL